MSENLDGWRRDISDVRILKETCWTRGLYIESIGAGEGSHLLWSFGLYDRASNVHTIYAVYEVRYP